MRYLVLIFSLLLAFASGYYGVKLFRLNRRVKSWPRACARITDKKVIPRKLATSSRANWTVGAEYSFVADGIKRTGNKIFLIELIKGEKGYLRKAAEDVIARLPEEVEIYYNPEDPEESVIYADGAWMGVVLILFVFAGLVGVAQFLS